jgi:CheY-like chemotaxis protein
MRRNRPLAIDLLLRSTDEVEVKTESSKRQTILLAEDEEVYRSLISAVLRKEGYNILVTQNGRQALECAEHCRRKINLLLTDVTMPEVEGPTLARYLQGIWCDLRVIVMSAHPAKTLNLGRDWTFINKPFQTSALVERIRQVLP